MNTHLRLREARRRVALNERDRALADSLAPAFAHAGLNLVIVDDVADWDADHRGGAMVVTALDERGWARLADAVATTSIVMGLVRAPEPLLYRRALLAGARAVAPVDATPDYVARSVRSALSGHALIPLVALQELCRSEVATTLSSDELSLLRHLVEGLGTDEVAALHCCSERTIYRRLKRLYNTLQVNGRSEAVVVARRLNILAGR